jgi:hypothetical protein
MQEEWGRPGEGLGVGGQAGGVPAVVTGELALQVAGGLGEWAEEESTVCAPSHARV